MWARSLLARERSRAEARESGINVGFCRQLPALQLGHRFFYSAQLGGVRPIGFCSQPVESKQDFGRLVLQFCRPTPHRDESSFRQIGHRAPQFQILNASRPRDNRKWLSLKFNPRQTSTHRDPSRRPTQGSHARLSSRLGGAIAQTREDLQALRTIALWSSPAREAGAELHPDLLPLAADAQLPQLGGAESRGP